MATMTSARMATQNKHWSRIAKAASSTFTSFYSALTGRFCCSNARALAMPMTSYAQLEYARVRWPLPAERFRILAGRDGWITLALTVQDSWIF
jgi:hypothetical protein